MGKKKETPEVVEVVKIDPESLKDIPGIGDVSRKKLEDRGIVSKRMIYTELSPTDLMTITGMDRDKADEAFEYIRNALEQAKMISKSLKTAYQLYQEQEKEPFLTTGCIAFDKLFGNGIKAGYLSEFYGENGSGKTQMGIALVLNTLIENPDSCVAYIDTEGKLKLERLVSILLARGTIKEKSEAEKYLNRIFILQPNTAEDQITHIGNISGMMDAKTPIKLLVIDSIISLFQGEYLERGVMKSKFNLIKPMMRRLKILAETYKIPVVCINTVYQSPTESFGKDPIIPAGGNSVGHPLAYRVKLREVGSGKKHRATLIKSPEYAENEADFQITDKGIEDV